MRKIICHKQRERRRRKIKMTRTQRRRRGDGGGKGGMRHRRRDRLLKMFPRSRHAVTLMFVETLIFLLIRENTNTKYL